MAHPGLRLLAGFDFAGNPQEISPGRGGVDELDALRSVVELEKPFPLPVAFVEAAILLASAGFANESIPPKTLDPDTTDLFIALTSDLLDRLSFRPHHDLFINPDAVDVPELPSIPPGMRGAVFAVGDVATIDYLGFENAGSIGDDHEFRMHVSP